MSRSPSLYQHVLVHVKPEHDQNNRDTYRLNWWIFGEPRREFRPALAGLQPLHRHRRNQQTLLLNPPRSRDFPRTTCSSQSPASTHSISVSCHRHFMSHGLWPPAAHSKIAPAITNPAASKPSHSPRWKKARSSSASALSASVSIHTASGSRSSIPASHSPALYNVLEKLRSSEPLTAKEKQIHDQGLFTVLRQIHDELDEAVLEAYGLSDLKGSAGVPPALANEESGRDAHAPLVVLNHERAAEEKRGLIRYLRPEYQNPTSAAPQPVQSTLAGTEAPSSKSKIQNQQSSINLESAVQLETRTIFNHGLTDLNGLYGKNWKIENQHYFTQ